LYQSGRGRSEAWRLIHALGAPAIGPLLELYDDARAYSEDRIRVVRRANVLEAIYWPLFLTCILGVCAYTVVAYADPGGQDIILTTITMALIAVWAWGAESVVHTGSNKALMARNSRLAALNEFLRDALTRLTEQDAPEVSGQAQSRLYELLRQTTVENTEHWDPAMASAILKAIRFIGSEAIEPDVERLANLTGSQKGPKRIRYAARECLPILRERIARESAREELLRPAAHPAQGTLVRPLVAHPDEHPESLLRPAQIENRKS
jgi:hypothetical protein